jgi:hypothetical protein
MGERHRIQGIDGENQSQRKFPIITRPIVTKGEKVEQIRQHFILGLRILHQDELVHIINTKAKAEKNINMIKCLAHTT